MHSPRAWVGDGHAHIEVGEVEESATERFHAMVRRRLERLPGVSWSEVLPGVARVVVAFDPTVASLSELVDAVAATEDAWDAKRARDASQHPGDGDRLAHELALLAGDSLSIVGGMVGRALGRSPLAIAQLAPILSVMQNHPGLRRRIERSLGRTTTDTVLAGGEALLQGLGQGPFAPASDGLLRLTRSWEFAARRRLWAAKEPALCARMQASSPISARVKRSSPLPNGPIESFADTALAGSSAGFALGLALTRRFDRAMSIFGSGSPKAARYGREGYLAQLGRTLARHGVLTLNAEGLRVLDRVDTVFIEERLLVGEDLLLGRVVAVAAVDELTVLTRASALFHPGKASMSTGRGGWRLGPLDDAGVSIPRGTMRQARELGRAGTPVLALVRNGTLVAVLGTERVLEPGAEQLLATARELGLRVVISSARRGLPPGLEREQRVATGSALRTLRKMQREGNVVCAVAGGASPLLGAADCAVGLWRDEESPPWAAHLLAGSSLSEAQLVLDAIAGARQASRQAVGIAVVGAAGAAAWSLAGPPTTAGERAGSVVNAAAVASLANGTRLAVAHSRRPPVVARRTPWHALDVGVVLERLGSSVVGLSTETATRRRGPVPTPPSSPQLLGRAVIEELANPLTPVLAVGAGLSAMIGSATDAVLVASVAAVNGVVGGVQRFQADRAVAALDRRSKQRVRTWRDGASAWVDANELVSGDVIELRAGELVPADCRVLEVANVEVDESALTGESLPVAKSVAPSFAAALGDRASMVYAGTSMAAGTLRGVVVAVGDATQARQALPVGASAGSRGVEARLRSLTLTTAPAGAVGAAILTVAGLARGQELAQVGTAGVSLAVAALPEGLPILATVAQLAAARRLSAQGALVRNARAIEAIGRVDVLCADKTGTLTEGRIRLRRVSDGQTDDDASRLRGERRRVLAAAIRATPALSAAEQSHLTDRAVVEGAATTGVRLDEGAPAWKVRHDLPFEPRRAFHATVGSVSDGEMWMLDVKGAPEVVVPRCCAWERGGRTTSLDAKGRARLVQRAARIAHDGLRVLAVAERRIPKGASLHDEQVSDLTFLGFIALADPVRPSAAEAVRQLQAAGVDVVMITGDHPSTAEAIAAELGIVNGHPVVTGPELDRMDEEEFAQAAASASVFARVAPTHKGRIVQAMQRAGRTVAMTGDGANDAPAIRLADIGIALGANATAAARDAADLIVLDERIETIVAAVAEGRALWASVREAVAILVGGNMGEIAFTVGGGLVTGVSPLNARQLLLVNLLTDAAPAMAIAARPPLRRSLDQLLQEGPERSLGSELNRAIAARAATTTAGAGVAYIAAQLTGRQARASTVGMVGLVATQLGQTLTSAGGDPVVWAAGLGSAGVLAVIVQTPVVSHFFGCTPLGPVGWSIALASATAATGTSGLLPRVLPLLAELQSRSVADARLDHREADAAVAASASRPARVSA